MHRCLFGSEVVGKFLGFSWHGKRSFRGFPQLTLQNPADQGKLASFTSSGLVSGVYRNLFRLNCATCLDCLHRAVQFSAFSEVCNSYFCCSEIFVNFGHGTSLARGQERFYSDPAISAVDHSNDFCVTLSRHRTPVC